MLEKADYNVSFGRTARTILYEDALGQLTLTFDVDTRHHPTVIYLYGPETAVEQPREQTVIDRVKNWLETKPYKVSIVS